jgi:aspartate aminotransferase-like enzyme
MNEVLFTVGPVEMHASTLEMAGRQLPYFRTREFSDVTLGCERDLLSLAGAPSGSRAIFLTCSGTGAMEAALINCLNPTDRALIIKGGSFGERFAEICGDVGIPFDALDLEPGRVLQPGRIQDHLSTEHRALVVNAHETSTGVLYDLDELGAACKKSGAIFIVDAISSFLCDTIDMEKMHIDVLITSSQKALALAPGLSVLVLSPRALEIASGIRPRSHYFALSSYLRDGLRGQTPFTPAVGTLLQLRARLDDIAPGGAALQVERVAGLAEHFRGSIAGTPFAIFPDRSSNALTALSPRDRSAYSVYEELKRQFGFVVTPNGGALRDRVFRVGHMGNLDRDKLDLLSAALREVLQ